MNEVRASEWPVFAVRLMREDSRSQTSATGSKHLSIQLADQPLGDLKSQSVISKRGCGAPFLMTDVTPKPENVAPLVCNVRGEKVLLDADLAALYGVGTKALNQAVSRNRSRFPEDFMFRLTAEEWRRLRSKITISNNALEHERSQTVTASRQRNTEDVPYAFTEQGIAMLSSVLRSPRAVEVNIAIMRTFVQLRRLMDSNRDLARKIEAMEMKYDEQFAVVFDAIKRLIAEDDSRKAQPKRRIGFVS